MSFGQDINGAYKLLDDGSVLRLHQRIFDTLLSLSMTLDDPGWREGWCYQRPEDAVSDFVEWEKGQKLVCVICGRERGGADPPRNWQRHYPSQRRRLMIFGPGNTILGHLEFVRD